MSGATSSWLSEPCIAVDQIYNLRGSKALVIEGGALTGPSAAAGPIAGVAADDELLLRESWADGDTLVQPTAAAGAFARGEQLVVVTSLSFGKWCTSNCGCLQRGSFGVRAPFWLSGDASKPTPAEYAPAAAGIGAGGEGESTGWVGWLLIGLALFLAVALTALVWLHVRIRRRERQLFNTVFNAKQDAASPSSPSAQPQWPGSSAEESSWSCSPSKIGVNLDDRHHRGEQAAAHARHERRRAERSGQASPRAGVGAAEARTSPFDAVSRMFGRGGKLRV